LSRLSTAIIANFDYAVITNNTFHCKSIAVDTFWIEKENALVAEGEIGQFYRYVNNKIVSNSGIGVIKDETGTILYPLQNFLLEILSSFVWIGYQRVTDRHADGRTGELPWLI